MSSESGFFFFLLHFWVNLPKATVLSCLTVSVFSICLFVFWFVFLGWYVVVPFSLDDDECDDECNNDLSGYLFVRVFRVVCTLCWMLGAFCWWRILGCSTWGTVS